MKAIIATEEVKDWTKVARCTEELLEKAKRENEN